MTDNNNPGRRKALKGVAAVGTFGTISTIGAMGASASLPAAAQGTPARTTPRVLSATETATLEAICARLIPGDAESPGAREARAAEYIDRSLADFLAGSRKAYAAGLAAVEAYAKSAKGAAFTALAPADQDELLSAMEKNAAKGFTPNSAAFFNLVRNHTIQGTFCDPAYGGNASFVGWDMIGYPGLRMAVAPEEQRMSVKPKPSRASAYVDANFSKGSNHGH